MASPDQQQQADETAAQPTLSADIQDDPTKKDSKTEHTEEDSELDELDDVLDDFNQSKPTAASIAETSSSSAKPSNAQQTAEEEAFVKQLEEDMLAQLLGGGGGSASNKGKEPSTTGTSSREVGAGGGGGGGTDSSQPLKFMESLAGDDFEKFREELDKEGGMEKLFQELQNMTKDATLNKHGAAGSAAGPAAAGPAGGETPESFSDAIKRTMERMKESGEKVTEEAQSGQDKLADASIERLLKMLEEAGPDGGNADVEQMFNGIMKEMSNKEMLYEPMKQYNEKYGPWLEENKSKLSEEKYADYSKQAEIVQKIMETFDSKDYSDDNAECRASIWNLMQEMEACGSPPEDIMKGAMGDGGLPSLGSFLENAPDGALNGINPEQFPPECNPQ